MQGKEGRNGRKRDDREKMITERKIKEVGREDRVYAREGRCGCRERKKEMEGKEGVIMKRIEKGYKND